ncbi:hypothetical protein B0T24DRAFT_253452 [Lasiosphaeria ovina]|uniref:Secreted protein n=1 Tax=Lasiosphaeria ovina TaxID=92902 RepID=A0AAE0N734_9PEZI|nr:hypothetical protein B0T24DRAFT_253452 [Lasiosphaeria ovina]
MWTRYQLLSHLLMTSMTVTSRDVEVVTHQAPRQVTTPYKAGEKSKIFKKALPETQDFNHPGETKQRRLATLFLFSLSRNAVVIRVVMLIN